MAIGDIIFRLMGQGDPQQQLLAAMATQQGGGATQGATPAPAATTGAGAGAAPAPQQAATPEADVYKSPNDLMNLYIKLSERNRANASIDRGLGLMAASLAQDANRPGIIQAMTAGQPQGATPNETLGAVGDIMKIQETQQALMQKAAIRASLPEIAKKYGLDLKTAQYLFESGKLKDVVSELEKPNREIVKNADGTWQIVDKTTQVVGASQGPKEVKGVVAGSDKAGRFVVDTNTGLPVGGAIHPAIPDTEVVGSDDTGRDLIRKDTGAVVRPGVTAPVAPKLMETGSDEMGRDLRNSRTGEVVAPIGGPVPPKLVETGSDAAGRQMRDSRTGQVVAPISDPISTTNDLKELAAINAERIAKGQPALTSEEWLRFINEKRAPKTSITNGANALSEGFAKTYVEDYKGADAATGTIKSVGAARRALDSGAIAGSKLSPYELEGRKIIADIFGIPDEATANTETFMAEMRNVVRTAVKDLGSGNSITDSDRSFIEKAVGASNELTPSAIRRIMDILDGAAKAKIDKFNSDLSELTAKNPEAGTYARRVFYRPVPPDAIEKLRNDPKGMSKYFDEAFGKGAANHYLGVH